MYEKRLKSCPICGTHENVHIACVSSLIKGYVAECADCGCTTKLYKRPEQALEAWNMRNNKKEYALKPCPLCGNIAEIGHYGYSGEEIDTELYAVRCSNCHFSTPNTSEDTIDDVIKIWNNRA